MDLLGDLEFAARLGDLESALRGDLEVTDLLGDLEFPDLLGDLEVLPPGDLDLFDPGDASLAFLAGDRSLDLELLLLLGERDRLGDLLRDLPPFIFASSAKRNLFPCSSVSSNLSKAASIYRRSVNSTNPSPLRSL